MIYSTSLMCATDKYLDGIQFDMEEDNISESTGKLMADFGASYTVSSSLDSNHQDPRLTSAYGF